MLLFLEIISTYYHITTVIPFLVHPWILRVWCGLLLSLVVCYVMYLLWVSSQFLYYEISWCVKESRGGQTEADWTDVTWTGGRRQERLMSPSSPHCYLYLSPDWSLLVTSKNVLKVLINNILNICIVLENVRSSSKFLLSHHKSWSYLKSTQKLACCIC